MSATTVQKAKSNNHDEQAEVKTKDVLAQMQELLAQLPSSNETSVVPEAPSPPATRRRGRPPKAKPQVAFEIEEHGMVQTGLVTPGQRTYATPQEAHSKPSAPVLPNKPTFDDLLKVANDLGVQAGQGRDVQIKFLLKVAEAAFLGTIDLDKDKHGTDKDDATRLTEEYVKAQGSATMFDAKAPNQRKTISCTRTMIKLGMWPKGGVGEPLGTLNNLIALRQKLRSNPANSKKLDDAANTALRYARAQLKRDQLIDTAGLQEFCFKAERDERTPEEILESIRKSAMALRDGKAAHGTAMDDSDEVKSIITNCTKRLTAIASVKRGAKKVA